MKGKINLKFALLGAVLSVMLLAPALSQAKAGKAEQFKKAQPPNDQTIKALSR